MPTQEINQLQSQAEHLYQKLIDYAPSIGSAIAVLVIGLWLVKRIAKVFGKALQVNKVDPTLIPFLTNLLSWSLKVLVVLTAGTMAKISTTPFVAILGAAGLAVGLALQGSLSNFAGGVLIMLFRPFRVGDVIEAQGQLGTVKEIQIFTTVLFSPQNERVVIPNGVLSNGILRNYSIEPYRRVDTTVGIAYGADLKKAKEVLAKMLKELPDVLEEPAPLVAVAELGDSSVNIAVRGYCEAAKYWDAYFAIVENTKLTLDEAGISIPFPQRDVHLFEVKK